MMEQKGSPQELIEKYLAGTCTEEEKNLVEHFYLDQFRKPFPEFEPSEGLKDEMWDHIAAHTTEKTRRIANWRTIAAIAATVLFFLGIGGYFLLPHKLVEPLAQVQHHDILPGSNKAILTLANGSHIALTDSLKGKIASQGNAAIIRSKDGEIKYAVS